MAVESSLNSGKSQPQIEILVHNLNLSKHKIGNLGTSSLCVRAEFIDPPTFEIQREEFVSSKKQAIGDSQPEKNCIDYKPGKTSLLLQLPTDLTKNQNLKPLKVQVIPKKELFIPLCETIIHFPNFVKKSSNLTYKSVPLIPKSVYNLIAQGKILGTIELSLSLVFGKSISYDSDNMLIEVPKTPPKAKMGDPEFSSLTTAEKMNDSKYRKLIYRTYPNEPTCKCENENAKTLAKFSTCPGGCPKKCCNSARKTLNKNLKNGSNDFASGRLRGGGEGMGNLENNYNRKNQFRLNGGGESNYCTSMPSNQQNYCCTDKAILESVMKRRSDQPSIKKPCLGPDCLIKAFEDAQEFVDSLGRVPGLPGLGLMDPGESPYFGRKHDDNDDDIKTEDSNNNLASTCAKKANRLFSEICNKKPENLNIIREYVPLCPAFSKSVIPGPKPKNKDDKSEPKEENSPFLAPEESGPCGDPKCRSRRRKPQVEGEETGILKESRPKSDEKNKDHKDKSKVDFSSHPSEKRNPRKNLGKRRPRAGKFIYSLGDSYPGVNCGHQNCKNQPDRVPANMGWLWKEQIPLGTLKPRIGWKPGAINSRLRQVLQEVKGNFLPENKSNTSLSRVRKRPMRKSRGIAGARGKRDKSEKVEEEWKEPPPTLHIQRKDGVYYVTMYPIKDDKMDIPKLEEPTKPLQFKIAKRRDDISEVASSIASDMEIEFSPPAAVNRHRKKPDLVHVETQVKQQEIIDAFKPPGTKKAEKKSGKEKKSKK